jgi:hypothetical protein
VRTEPPSTLLPGSSLPRRQLARPASPRKGLVPARVPAPRMRLVGALLQKVGGSGVAAHAAQEQHWHAHSAACTGRAMTSTRVYRCAGPTPSTSETYGAAPAAPACQHVRAPADHWLACRQALSGLRSPAPLRRQPAPAQPPPARAQRRAAPAMTAPVPCTIEQTVHRLAAVPQRDVVG